MSDVDQKNGSSRVVFTVCNLAYLPKALVLADSLIKFKQPKLKIFLFDRKIDIELPIDIADFIWIEDVGIKYLYNYAFKYDIVEFSTSLKPYITLELLKTNDNVVFLDPDTCLFNSLDSIWNDLRTHDVILTPHYVTPKADSDVGMMRFGSFNLGFYAVNNTPEANRFLNWWSERCLDLCYFETQFGLSTDQKWVSIAPCFFPDLHVSFNLGYNVAFWNVHERTICADPDGGFLVNNKYPLIFFHFSSFDEDHPELLSKRPFSDQQKKRSDLLELSLLYKRALDIHKSDISKSQYAFDYMSDGQYISPVLRRAYASIIVDIPFEHDPFDSNGIVADFAKKNHLFEKRGGYRPNGFGDIERNKKKFIFINMVMRGILYFIGPNRFMNFSRLLVYLSSYRLNRDLWKF